MSLSRQVLDRHNRCINLRDQRGGLTSKVLRSLRNYLLHNDHYIHLFVSDNLLEGETIAELCGLVRKHPHLTTLEVQHSGISDKYFRFYFGPAIATMPSLTSLDLSRNARLTDLSADMVARILIETELETLRLLGTSFTEKGGRVIVKAAASSPSLILCELPFTVGEAVLEEMRILTNRNRAHRAMLNNAMSQYMRVRVGKAQERLLPPLKHLEAETKENREVPPSLNSLPDKSFPLPLVAPGYHVKETEMERHLACVKRGRRHAVNEGGGVWGTQSPTVEAPSAHEITTHEASSAGVPNVALVPPTSKNVPSLSSSPLPRLLEKKGNIRDNFKDVTVWDLVDPAISSTLSCLDRLDHQAQVLTHQRTSRGVATRDLQRRKRLGIPTEGARVTVHLPRL